MQAPTTCGHGPWHEAWRHHGDKTWRETWMCIVVDLEFKKNSYVYCLTDGKMYITYF